MLSQSRLQGRCWAVAMHPFGHDLEVPGPTRPCSGPSHLEAWLFCALHLVIVTVSSPLWCSKWFDDLVQMQCALLPLSGCAGLTDHATYCHAGRLLSYTSDSPMQAYIDQNMHMQMLVLLGMA